MLSKLEYPYNSAMHRTSRDFIESREKKQRDARAKSRRCALLQKRRGLSPPDKESSMKCTTTTTTTKTAAAVHCQRKPTYLYERTTRPTPHEKAIEQRKKQKDSMRKSARLALLQKRRGLSPPDKESSMKCTTTTSSSSTTTPTTTRPKQRQLKPPYPYENELRPITMGLIPAYRHEISNDGRRNSRDKIQRAARQHSLQTRRGLTASSPPSSVKVLTMGFMGFTLGALAPSIEAAMTPILTTVEGFACHSNQFKTTIASWL